ncbi:MAG: hypothetical protein U1D30_15455 [Planctomycetota bacterium]
MLNIHFLAACLLVTAGNADLNRENDGIVYSPHQAFRIPLDLTNEERAQVSAIRLYVSEDQGNSWVLHSDGAPDMKIITFRATRDGSYWFSIAMVDHQGKQVPADIRAVEPGLRVVVDTAKPDLVLKPIKSKSGKRGVRWELADEHAVPGTIRLAVWENDISGWKPLEIRHPEKSMTWFADGADVRKIQAITMDRAGNETVTQVDVHGDRFARQQPNGFALAAPAVPATPVAEATPIPTAEPRNTREQPDVQRVRHTAPTQHTVASPPHPPTQKMSICKSNQVVVNYEVEKLGAAANSAVELWGTKDRGSSWVRLSVDEDRQSPIEAKLDQEGVWGLLIAVAGSPGYQAPQPGTEPEVYVEIDTVSPFIEVMAPQVMRDQAVIRWNAIDKNLAQVPIDLFYGPSPEGPWTLIAGELDNNGEFIWNFARAGINGEFHVRVEAVDQAGNVGAGLTDQKVVLGSSPAAATTNVPRGRVLGVQPQ